MTSAWIPGPVAVVWTVLFVVVLLVHLGHAGVMRGRHRFWHIGHVLMAAGMVVMFWLAGSGGLVPARPGVVVFVAAALVLGVSLVVAWARGVALGPLWLVSVADLAWMAYMFAMTGTRLVWLSVLGVVWFGVQVVGWAGGRLGRVLEHGGLGDPAPGSLPLVSQSVARSTAGSAGSGEAEAASGPVGTGTPAGVAQLRGVIDGGHRDWSVRASLTVMALGMAYMLLAMQFGMSPMPSMTGGMPGMGGM